MSMSMSAASGGMECLRNKDCGIKYEHLCNMQRGLWTKNYVLLPRNGSFVGKFTRVSKTVAKLT